FQGLMYFARTDREMFFRERGLKQFIDSGAIMGMGTDSGTPMNFHTEALWREIKAHVDMGMSPQRAIMAATRVNARSVLGLPDRGRRRARARRDRRLGPDRRPRLHRRAGAVGRDAARRRER